METGFSEKHFFLDAIASLDRWYESEWVSKLVSLHKAISIRLLGLVKKVKCQPRMFLLTSLSVSGKLSALIKRKAHNFANWVWFADISFYNTWEHQIIKEGYRSH